MADKKKVTIGIVSVLTAAALMLGGTLAWQSISQTAVNEKQATINPGGRLHNDFDGKNNDVYVENFAEDDIFARVRLDEYFEIIINKNTAAEKTEVITAGATKDDTASYITHKFDADNITDDWWEWTTGGSTVYMPTFNKNKDSLKADINGTMSYIDGEGKADPCGDYVDYSKFTGKNVSGAETTGIGAGKTANAIYDSDDNDIEDEGITSIEETHYVATTGTAKLISIEEWLQLDEDGEETGNYWVYDTDGWAYYSSPIESGTASGLLLNEVKLATVMDDSYYYAVNVVGQFITADDLGKDDNTGFYADDESVTEEALELLEKIGVDVGNTTADDDTDNAEDDIEVTSLTVTSYTEGRGAYSIESNLGNVYIGAKVHINDDQIPCNSEYELIDGFTMKIYEKGGSEPVCVKTGDELIYDWDHDTIVANFKKDGLNMSHSGKTEFEVEIIYSKGEQTITADKVSYTVQSYVFDLSEEGTSYEGVTTRTSAFITLNGTVPNWANLKFTKDGTELVCMLNSSGTNAYYSDTKDADTGDAWLTLDALPDPIRFRPSVAGTYTISIEEGGKTYTSTITVSEPQ